MAGQPSVETLAMQEPAPPIEAPSRAATVPRGLYSSSRASAAMGLYVPATILIRVINFARVILLTWFMSTQQFGLLTMLLLVINVLTPVCSLGLTEAVTRYAPQYEARASFYPFLKRALYLISLVTVITTMILLVVSPLLGMRFYGQFFYDEAIRSIVRAQFSDLTKLSAIVIALQTFYFFLLAILKGLRMIRALVVVELLHSVAFVLLAVAACVQGHASAFTMTACYGMSLVVAMMPCGVGLWYSLRGWQCQQEPCLDQTLYKRLLAFSYWAMISGVTWQLLQYYPAWYLNKIMGNEAVAVFGAVRQIGQFVLLAAVTLVTVVMTVVTKTWETRGAKAADSQLSLAFRAAGAMMFVGSAVLALSRDFIIRLFRDDYVLGADILPLQLLFFVIGGFFAFIALHFNLIEKPRLHFLPYAVGVAANILLATWLVGPRSAWLQARPEWQALAPLTTAVFPVHFSDRLGLGGASWAGVFAIGTALVTCLLILRAEGRRLDRGSYLVLASVLLLATKPGILLAGAVVFVWVAIRTELIFTGPERHELKRYVHDIGLGMRRGQSGGFDVP